jgi:hypothetical protein
VAASLGKSEGIYCYEDSALLTFQAASRMGMKRYYELDCLAFSNRTITFRGTSGIPNSGADSQTPTLLILQSRGERLVVRRCGG